MNEQILESAYASYCESLLALKRSGDWKPRHKTWEDYAKARLGLSKSRAKLLCGFAKFRALLEAELFGTLPESPEQVKALLALPQRQWVEAWELVITDNGAPISPQNVDSTLQRFHLYAHKKLAPDVVKAIRVRRAAKVMAEMQNGTELVGEIGGRALGVNWTKAVEVIIDADQARLDEQ
jgi:hypothetical protein